MPGPAKLTDGNSRMIYVDGEHAARLSLTVNKAGIGQVEFYTQERGYIIEQVPASALGILMLLKLHVQSFDIFIELNKDIFLSLRTPSWNG